MALLKMPPQQTNTLWSSSQQHGAFSLTFRKNAQLLIVLCQAHIAHLEGKGLSHPNPRFIEEHEQRPISDVRGRNGLEDLHHILVRQWTWFSFGLRYWIKTFHRIIRHQLLPQHPMVEGTQCRVAPRLRGLAMVPIPLQKALDKGSSHLSKIRWNGSHKVAQIMGIGFRGIGGNVT